MVWRYSVVVQFCGQDRCLVDANGRIKLSARFLADFRRIGDQVVMHCLPEGALGIYPAPVWDEIRLAGATDLSRVGRSVAFRRQLRRFGALTQGDRITNQGRITLPAEFRQHLELVEQTDVIVVGCEIGVEVWNAERWSAELDLLQRHEDERAAADMVADLQPRAGEDGMGMV